jgi:hypothetical protein
MKKKFQNETGDFFKILKIKTQMKILHFQQNEEKQLKKNEKIF